MYTYVYTYIYLQIFISIYMYTYVYIYIYIYIYIHLCVYIRIYSYIYIWVNSVFTYVQTCVYVCLHTCILFANRCILAACTTSTRCSCSQHLQLPPHVSSHASVSALITQALFVQDSATPLPAHILLSAFSQGSCCIG